MATNAEMFFPILYVYSIFPDRPADKQGWRKVTRYTEEQEFKPFPEVNKGLCPN